jgi:predicted alpha/beta-hydrolase family hydrolase
MKVRYLVIGEATEVGYQPPNEMAQFIEQAIIPSIQTMAKMENDKQILGGGIYAGGRVGVAIVEAKDNAEVSNLLQQLPFWGALKWTVTPLDTYSERLEQIQEQVARMKK